MSRSRFVFPASLIVLLVLLGGGYQWYEHTTLNAEVVIPTETYKTPEEAESVFVRFTMEVFDVISEEYWKKLPENELVELFRLSLQKAKGDVPVDAFELTRTELARVLAKEFDAILEDKRKALAHDTSLVALVNLAPQGRSGLLSEKQEIAFRDVVNNVDRDTNLYESLGLPDGASTDDVATAYVEKKTELEAEATPEAAIQLAEVERAKDVLSEEASKAVYDEAKIEPSLVSRTIAGHILYVDLAQVTPATFQEFITALTSTGENPALDSLIIDMRGNMGGTLDFAKYMLALFVGPNQYAYDLFHQGDAQIERTPQIGRIPGLAELKDVAILVDGETRSTAELTTSMFKRFNLGVVVGKTTKGWGTVENTFPLKTQFDETEKYSVLLVHSLMVRDDGEAIEGFGVVPDVDLGASNWKEQVRERFHIRDFEDAVIKLLEA